MMSTMSNYLQSGVITRSKTYNALMSSPDLSSSLCSTSDSPNTIISKLLKTPDSDMNLETRRQIDSPTAMSPTLINNNSNSDLVHQKLSKKRIPSMVPLCGNNGKRIQSFRFKHDITPENKSLNSHNQPHSNFMELPVDSSNEKTIDTTNPYMMESPEASYLRNSMDESVSHGLLSLRRNKFDGRISIDTMDRSMELCTTPPENAPSPSSLFDESNFVPSHSKQLFSGAISSTHEESTPIKFCPETPAPIKTGGRSHFLKKLASNSLIKRSIEFDSTAFQISKLSLSSPVAETPLKLNINVNPYEEDNDEETKTVSLRLFDDDEVSVSEKPLSFDHFSDDKLQMNDTPLPLDLCLGHFNDGDAKLASPLSIRESEKENKFDEEGEPKLRLHRQNSLGDTKLLFTAMKRQVSSKFLFESHFEYLNLIGRGAFSEVYRARHHSDGRIYAIKKSLKKIYSKSERDRDMLEIKAVEELEDHENIVKYYRAWQDDQHFFIQTEFCAGGSLKDRLKLAILPISEDWLHFLLKQVASGIEFIHRNGVIHLDIKPDNIFVSKDGVLKIGDFGLAMRQSGNNWSEDEGDCKYLAPELLKGKAGPEADVFSTGLTFYEMATGIILPQNGLEWSNLRQDVIYFPVSMSSEFKNLLESMLASDPRKRPTASDICNFPIIKNATKPPH